MLKQKVELEDLIELSPTVGKNLKDILYKEQDIKSMDLTFDIDIEDNDKIETILLKEVNEEDNCVTNENK